MSLQDLSLKRCFDDLAQIDAEIRALADEPAPPRLGALIQDCCRRLRQQREAVLVRLQIGVGSGFAPSPRRRRA